MEPLHLLQYLLSLFHLSPLDWVIAVIVVLLTFRSQVRRLLRIEREERLEEFRSRVSYKRELQKLKEEEAQLDARIQGPGADAKDRLSA